GRQEIPSLQPANLREPREIRDAGEVRPAVATGEDPAHVRPPEAALDRRMDVLRLVRVPVVLAVMSRPPEDAFLRARHRQPGEQELKDPAGLVGAMREEAVVARGDAEHP